MLDDYVRTHGARDQQLWQQAQDAAKRRALMEQQNLENAEGLRLDLLRWAEQEHQQLLTEEASNGDLKGGDKDAENPTTETLYTGHTEPLSQEEVRQRRLAALDPSNGNATGKGG